MSSAIVPSSKPLACDDRAIATGSAALPDLTCRFFADAAADDTWVVTVGCILRLARL